MVVESGVIPVLVPILTHPDNKVLLPVLRTLGNITTGSTEETQAVLDGGILPYLPNLATDTTPDISAEVMWMLSNIVADSEHHIQMVIDAGLMPAVMERLGCGKFSVQKEAVWIVSNCLAVGTPEQVKYMVEQGAVGTLCHLLASYATPSMITTILDGLNNTLSKAGEDSEVILTQMKEADGLDMIEKLQQHGDQNIYRLACSIKSHFPDV
ncbi:Importin subunit alpha-4 [Geodia barretti]|uniref:Importin subunit alpha-4 n=3 Tax=Geodia barretti TaxID=519541 RepID=A0AA35QXX2_GEOBA|nr:Importin subunit alpha-4 [Geodia barretti]